MKVPHSLCEILIVLCLLTNHAFYGILVIGLMILGTVGIFFYDWARYKFNYPTQDSFRQALRKANGLSGDSQDDYLKRRDIWQRIF